MAAKAREVQARKAQMQQMPIDIERFINVRILAQL